MSMTTESLVDRKLREAANALVELAAIFNDLASDDLSSETGAMYARHASLMAQADILVGKAQAERSEMWD